MKEDPENRDPLVRRDLQDLPGHWATEEIQETEDLTAVKVFQDYVVTMDNQDQQDPLDLLDLRVLPDSLGFQAPKEIKEGKVDLDLKVYQDLEVQTVRQEVQDHLDKVEIQELTAYQGIEGRGESRELLDYLETLDWRVQQVLLELLEHQVQKETGVHLDCKVTQEKSV